MRDKESENGSVNGLKELSDGIGKRLAKNRESMKHWNSVPYFMEENEKYFL